MAKGLKFQGKIMIKNYAQIETSPFRSTNWDDDTPTLPAQTITGWSSTNWDDDSANVDENAIGFKINDD